MAKKSAGRRKSGSHKLPPDIRHSMRLRKTLDKKLRTLEKELEQTFTQYGAAVGGLKSAWKDVRRAALVVAYGGDC